MTMWPALLLALVCCWPAAQLHAEDELTGLLRRMGLQGLFVELQPLVEVELQQAAAVLDAASASALRVALAADVMQGSLEGALREEVDAGLLREALDALDSESLRPLLDSCHGDDHRDRSVELAAYETRLSEQPPVASRVSLVQQLDGVSRSSRLAALAQGTMERLVAGAAGSDGGAIPWQQVEQTRLAALQRGARDWYLFCARFYPDAVVARLVDRYARSAVQQVLDRYEAALQRSFEQAASEVHAVSKAP